MGRLILERPLKNKLSTIDLGGFSNSVYSFEVRSADGQSTRKVIKTD